MYSQTVQRYFFIARKEVKKIHTGFHKYNTDTKDLKIFS